MARMKMTAADKAAIKEAVEKVATDVAESVTKEAEPKPKKKSTAKTTAKKSTVPKAEPPKPSTHKDIISKQDDPLQGVKVDPDARPNMILNLIVSIDGDEAQAKFEGKSAPENMDGWQDSVRDTLKTMGLAKNVTVLLSKYAVEGKHILSHHYEAALPALEEEND